MNYDARVSGGSNILAGNSLHTSMLFVGEGEGVLGVVSG